MVKLLIILFAMLVVGITLTTLYLTPDDLISCSQKPSSEKGCQKADAIVAISGGNTSARTQEAIEMYQNGWADLIIFSGAAADKTGPSNAEVMRQQAIAAGIPQSHILIDPVSQTTKQNAELTQKLFTTRDISRVILVTSQYHQRRASLEFRARAGHTIAIINHPTSYDKEWSSWWWLTPRGWWLAVGEIVKIIAFYTGQSQ